MTYYLAIDIGASSGRHVVGWQENNIIQTKEIYRFMAQAESENISANVRWGIRQRMKSGTFAFRYNILGYRKGADGQPEIVHEEAEHTFHQ